MAGLPGRQTRSQSRQREMVVPENLKSRENVVAAKGPAASVSGQPKIRTLPLTLTIASTSLETDDLQLLVAKREKLRAPDGQLQRFITEQRSSSPLSEAVCATFVFAQEEAGTAVCISQDGLLLTCSHCIADTAKQANKLRMWLASAVGRVVQAQCIAWDGKRALALMQIKAAETVAPDEDEMTWAFARLANVMPKAGTKLVCVGHPGSEDLEASIAGQATGYDVLHVSDGRYRGLGQGQDVHDNSEIGALKHDCWTYWGHSGAPLIELKNGELVGLHSSWDDQTGMRRGIAIDAVLGFLTETGHLSRIGTRTDAEENPGGGESISEPIVIE